VRTQLADGKRQATKRISELEAALATSADESTVLQRRVDDLAAWKAAAAERQPALEAALAKAEAERKKGSEERNRRVVERLVQVSPDAIVITVRSMDEDR
jgi:hypothetical protein